MFSLENQDPDFGIRDSQKGKNEDSAFMLISYYIYLNDNFYKIKLFGKNKRFRAVLKIPKV